MAKPTFLEENLTPSSLLQILDFVMFTFIEGVSDLLAS